MKYFLTFLISILLFLGLNWLFLFPLSLNFVTMAIIVGLFVIIAAIVLSIDFKHDEFHLLGIFIPIIVVILFLGYAFFNSALFRANDYKNLIGGIKTETFSKDISPIDITQIPVVDSDYAEKLAEKKLGEDGAIGSQVITGTPVKQTVKDHLYWVVPLLHNGFFSWNSNSNGTPGYIMVNATNADDITFVKELNGNPINIKYQPNAFFGDNLERHIHFNEHLFTGLIDESFEIDDNGKPYWVVTKYRNTIGFNGKKVTGVVIVDAQTGDIQDYDTNNIPDWVDRIQPEDLVKSQLNSYGEYINGFQWFTNNNKLQVTDGGEIIYNNGVCYYYNGLTSVGKDNATIGFTLTNTKTLETTLYDVSGATESASIKSAEGKVQNMGYVATSPILLNIENIPTYFTTLKDKNGVVRMYAMIKVADYNVVGIGDNVKSAMSDYAKALGGSGDVTALDSSGKSNNIKATVLRIGQEVTNNVTYYHIITKENPTVIYVVALDASNELPITQAGDKIQLNYVDDSGIVINVTGFDNLDFNQTKSDVQKSVESQNQSIRDKEQTDIENKATQSVQDGYNNLSDEGKKKVLDIINNK